jgi:membrane-associated phospholipid phosphatase
MAKILAAMLWPAELAVIVAAAALLTRHLPAAAKMPSADASGSPPPAQGRDADDSAGRRPHVPGFVRFCVIVLAGSAVIYAVMVPLGLLASHAGPALDKPLLHWILTHRVHRLQEVLGQVTQIGNANPSVVAGCTGAVCLAWSWRENRWVPPTAIAALLVVAYLVTLAINHTVHRAPPPGSHGTFPSGGSASAIAVYGLIGYLLWREFSATRRGAIWTAAVVAALGFSEGFSRGYLAAHWFTDILGGLLYGCLLLGLFIVAVRHIVGPARTPRPALIGAQVDTEEASAAWIYT